MLLAVLYLALFCHITQSETTTIDPLLSPETKLKFHRCCKFNEVLDETLETCIPTQKSSQWLPDFFSLNSEDELELYTQRNHDMEVDVHNGFPSCHEELLTIGPNLTIAFNFSILTDGKLYFPDIPRDATIDKYCIDRRIGSDNSLYAKYCLEPKSIKTECTNHLCIPVCCGKNGYHDGITCHTDSSKALHNISFYDKVGAPIGSPKYALYGGFPDSCSEYPGQFASLNFSTMNENEMFYLQSDGRLYNQEHDTSLVLGEYCLTNDDIGNLIGYTCIENKPMTLPVWSHVTQALSLISILFLILTIFVICKHRNTGSQSGKMDLHTKMCLCYASSLLLGYTFLFLATISPLAYYPVWFCAAVGVMCQFFFLCIFFWLNAMSFDILRFFWQSKKDDDFWRQNFKLQYSKFENKVDMAAQNGSLAENTRCHKEQAMSDNKKLLCYCLYGFGIPTIITSVSLLINYTTDASASIIRPGYAESTCFLLTEVKVLWAYLYGYIAVLLIINVIIFILASIIVWRQRHMANHKKNKKMLMLCLRLFIIMGLTWIAEIVSWQTTKYGLVREEVWYLTDVINSLQGVLVFVMFIVGNDKLWCFSHCNSYSPSESSDA